MPETVLVQKAVAAGVVGRVDVDALDALSELLLQQVERLPVLGVDQQAVSLVVEVVEGGVGQDGVDQRLVLGSDEQAGVHHQRRQRLHLLQGAHRLLELTQPVGAQAFVRQQARPVAGRDLAERDQPVGVDDLLLEGEQVLLEGLGGVEELDDAAGHGVEGARDDAGGGVGTQVQQRIEVAEDDVLDEAIFLATEEAVQVLMDEVVGVLPDVETVERLVDLQQGVGGRVLLQRFRALLGIAAERLEGLMFGQGIAVGLGRQAKLVDALDLAAFGLVVVLAEVLEDGLVALLVLLPQVGMQIGFETERIQDLRVDLGLGRAGAREAETRDVFTAERGDALEAVELDACILVVVLRRGLVVTARLDAEHQLLAQHVEAHFGKAVCGLDVVAVLVPVVKQGVGAVVVGFVGHLEGVGCAAVVAEVAVLVVQLEEVQQVVVELGLEMTGAVLLGL